MWLPEKLKTQRLRLDRDGETALCHTREIWLRNGVTVSQKKQKHRREGDLFYDSLKKCIIGPSTVLLRRSVFKELGGFDETLEIAEDYEFWLRWTDRFPVVYCDEPLIVKRAGNWPQLSTRYGQIEIFRLRALLLLLKKRMLSEEHCFQAAEEAARKAEVYVPETRANRRSSRMGENCRKFEEERRMRKKGWFVFFCLLLLSFELVRPAEIVWFGVYSDTESLTDLQRSALEKTILQNIEDRGEVTLLHSTESVEMPADLSDAFAFDRKR